MVFLVCQDHAVQVEQPVEGLVSRGLVASRPRIDTFGNVARRVEKSVDSGKDTLPGTSNSHGGDQLPTSSGSSRTDGSKGPGRTGDSRSRWAFSYLLRDIRISDLSAVRHPLRERGTPVPPCGFVGPADELVTEGLKRQMDASRLPDRTWSALEGVSRRPGASG